VDINNSIHTQARARARARAYTHTHTHTRTHTWVTNVYNRKFEIYGLRFQCSPYFEITFSEK